MDAFTGGRETVKGSTGEVKSRSRESGLMTVAFAVKASVSCSDVTRKLCNVSSWLTSGSGSSRPAGGSPGRRGTAPGHFPSDRNEMRDDTLVMCILVWMFECATVISCRHPPSSNTPPCTMAWSTTACTLICPLFQLSRTKRFRVWMSFVGRMRTRIATGVKQLLSGGGFAVKGNSIGGKWSVVRGLDGSLSGDISMLDRFTVTLSNRLIPQRPMDFQASCNILSPATSFTPATSPASTPTLPRTSSHTPPSPVVFKTSTPSGPRSTTACWRISSGEALTARER